MPGGKYPVQLYQVDNDEQELILWDCQTVWSLSYAAGLSISKVGITNLVISEFTELYSTHQYISTLSLSKCTAHTHWNSDFDG